VRQLFWLAQLGRQFRYEPGHAIYRPDVAVTTVHFLLDGAVTVSGPDGKHDVRAPAALGFEEVLEGSPMQGSVVTAERSIVLSLTSDEFLALLSENVELSQGIFRMMIVSHGLVAGNTLIPGTLAPDVKDRAQEGRPIDRMLVLQSSPLLAHATATQLWRLSAIARPVVLAPGKEVIQRGGAAAILIVLSGSLKVELPDSVATADTGDVIGMYETLAGLTIEATVTAVTASHILRLERDDLFELLADHTDLLQGVFSILLRAAGSRPPADRPSRDQPALAR